jgi:hypothetical protein
MRYRSATLPWLLAALLLLLPLAAACGPASDPATGGGSSGNADTGTGRIIPLEGQPLSGQDRAAEEGEPKFLAFDARG